VAEFRDTIASYQKAAGKDFDLGPAADAAASLAAALDAFYAAAGKGKIAPGAANAVILRLARLLVPANYTRGPRFRHDPATPIPALPTLAPAADLKGQPKAMKGFAKTQLTRGQNRLVATLREAERLVRAAG
jgi:hypothetical protein